MKHVKYVIQDDDTSVHFLKDGEWTLCGCAYEGAPGDGMPTEQGFQSTNEKVNCWQCIRIVELCKPVKQSEMNKPIL
jgi:hypothetical protein